MNTPIKNLLIFTFTLFALMLGHNSDAQNGRLAKDSLNAKQIAATNKPQITKILCDSVYKGKGYKIVIKKFFDSDDYDETDFNALFILYKFRNGRYAEIYRDSILTMFEGVEFEDFNGDNVDDILVENISDVQSNLTYYLYLVDTTNDKLKKVKGFEDIKNPEYLPKYDLVYNYVSSGTDWTSFYKIKGNRVKDFGITIYDNHTENYDRDFDKAIRSILIREKKKHKH
jgi:hypothetical protein